VLEALAIAALVVFNGLVVVLAWRSVRDMRRR
jgi:hypothetical protein